MFNVIKVTGTIFVCTYALMSAGCATPSGNQNAKSVNSELNHSELHVSSIPKSTPIHVHLFNTEQLTLNSDTARTVANSAPHLLAADIVSTLRNVGFSQVTLDETKGGAAADSMTLVGTFTKLTPGSQNLRLWIGFGAGQSKICVEGKLNDAQGVAVGTFTHCENGIGWGESKPQVEVEAKTIGEKIGLFVSGISA